MQKKNLKKYFECSHSAPKLLQQMEFCGCSKSIPLNTNHSHRAVGCQNKKQLVSDSCLQHPFPILYMANINLKHNDALSFENKQFFKITFNSFQNEIGFLSRLKDMCN